MENHTKSGFFKVLYITASETKVIMDRLDEIKSELGYIKKHMVDADVVLTEEDTEALNEAEEDYKKGRMVKL